LRLPATYVFALALAAHAQTFGVPRIGAIEYYGMHKLSTQRIAKPLGLQPGDPLPPSKADVEDLLEKIPGVVQARLEAVCCEPDGKAILFVGIEEKAAPHFAFRSFPTGTAGLPPDIVDHYGKMMRALDAAGRRGSTEEDLTQGHPLAADPDARVLQQGLVAWAGAHLDLLRTVVRDCADDDQRAMAATILGYAPDKTKVVDDLDYAMQDPDESVRANAMRALGAIAVLAAREPERGIHVAATWFIEMLNSIVLSDRLKAASALVNLTERDGKATLAQIRARAAGSVLEMAQWKNLRYALPPFILLGRMAGLSEEAIQANWTGGTRSAVVMRFAGKR
jgi:hypothetical protein